MRRVFAMLSTASLLTIVGCSRSYDYRLEKTVDDMKYTKRLDDNLTSAATKGKFDELLIYIRPPQKMSQSQEFLLGAPAEGMFDLEQSFQEGGKKVLNVLARYKRPKTAKKKVQTPADTAPRGDFASDVLALINAAYKPAEELVITKFKPVEKKRAGSARANDFRFTTFTSGDKTVQVYFYKKDPYDVALIFEYPTPEHGNLQSKINLCLESFAVGERAKLAFSGAGVEEETGSAGTAVTF